VAEPVRRDAERRRSQRVLLRVRVVVHGKAVNGSTIEEETLTTVVNAHGALIDLAAKVQAGQPLVLQNRDTGEKQECRVIHLGPKQGEKFQIGLEFAQPAPRFWHIDFPPETWNSQQGAARPVPETPQAKVRP